MSEQENKPSGGSGGSVVMVDKTGSSRHRPYRPTELQEEPTPDIHKRSKAPAVPSLADELKNITLSGPPASPERMECDKAASDKHTLESKKPSRRGSTAEEIPMKETLASSPQPIPASVESVSTLAEKTELDKRVDDDSITEEITELRTGASVKEHSEWSDDEEAGGLPRSESRSSRVGRAVRQLLCCGVAYQPGNSGNIKKKEITWQHDEYLDKVHLQGMKARSLAAILERKASVGPCFKPNTLFGGPSGITVCVPKKSVRSMKEEFNPIPSIINFNVSKKMLSKSTSVIDKKFWKVPKKQEKIGIQIASEERRHSCFSLFRMKLDTMTGKIRHLLKM